MTGIDTGATTGTPTGTSTSTGSDPAAAAATRVPDEAAGGGGLPELTLGRRRRLAQIADGGGRLALLAIDQRGNLRRALRPDDPGSVGSAELVAFKREVVAALAPGVSGVLLDPEFGAAQAIASGALPGDCGLIVALEETGYEESPTDRRTALLDGFDPAGAARLGASAAKLLLYFHPDAPGAGAQAELVAEVAEACRAVDLPLILEPLSFSLDPDGPLTPAERRRVVVTTAEVLTPLGVDLLKAEFPVDAARDPDRGSWADACAELSAVSRVPWLLLSAGVGFELFCEQTTVACDAGASGVLAGRAVWKEATALDGAERARFLAGTATDRLRRLRELVGERARPIWEGFAPTPLPADDWYRHH